MFPNSLNLTPSMLGNNLANSIMKYLSYLSQKTGFDISCQFSLLEDNLHEMSKPVSEIIREITICCLKLPTEGKSLEYKINGINNK